MVNDFFFLAFPRKIMLSNRLSHTTNCIWVQLLIRDVLVLQLVWCLLEMPGKEFKQGVGGFQKIVQLHRGCISHSCSCWLSEISAYGFVVEPSHLAILWLASPRRWQATHSLSGPGRRTSRLSIFRDMLPDPPEHYTPHQRRQFHQEEWDKLCTPTAPSGHQPRAKAKAVGFFGFGATTQGRFSARRSGGVGGVFGQHDVY